MNILKLKADIRRRDGFRCTKCGMTNAEHLATRGKQLEVHRLIPNSPYTAEGCVTLCKRCHSQQPRCCLVKQGRPSRGILTASLYVYLHQSLADALEDYVASSDPQVSKTAAVESSLKLFLEQVGRWPPPPQPQEQGED